MQQYKPEILAPAGNMQGLVAAVRCGANAVYLGGKDFNARRSALNFSDEELREAVLYCHTRGVKVYLAVNTIMADDELAAVLAQLQAGANAGVDAVIVQDLGVAQLLRQACSSMPLHASTQLTVHNVASAQAAKALGFTRAVLARELSLPEITAITAKSGIETEVFVHGALCMCVSGQCYLSSLIGGRSGNRGLCAQPCRLPFVGESAGPTHALSLKDMSIIDRLPALVQAGVQSFKIEGRMKRPEYVAAAVTACVNALEGKAVDFTTLSSVFSRSGFTAGYYRGNLGQDMFGTRQKEDVTAATNKLLAGLESLYRHETPLVDVDFTLQITPDAPAMLTATAGAQQVQIQGSVPQVAINRPTDEALARRSLEKTGGTPYRLRVLDCRIDDGLMLPVSALNAMRAEALEKLEAAARGAVQPHVFTPPASAAAPQPRQEGVKGRSAPALRARLQTISQLTPELAQLCSQITLPLSQLLASDHWLPYQAKILGEISPVLFPTEETKATEALATLKSKGLLAVTAGNIGGFTMAKQAGLAVHGDFALNTLNALAAKEVHAMGAASLCLCVECDSQRAQSIATHSSIPTGIVAYGYLPLMTTRNCPIRGKSGCGSCTGKGTLTDRLDNVFTVDCVQRTVSRLLNTVPLYVGDKPQLLNAMDFAQLYFTYESAAECLRVAQLVTAGENYAGKKTAGLYFRELQ